MKKDINRYDIHGTTAALCYASFGDYFYDRFLAVAETPGVDITKKSILGRKLRFLFNYRAATVLPVGSTVLHAAASSCGIKALRYTLDKDVIDVNATDEDGFTALDRAYQKQRDNLTKLFNSIGSRVKLKPTTSHTNMKRARKNVKLLNVIDVLQEAGGVLNVMHDKPILNLEDAPCPIQHKKIKAILFADTPRQRLLTIM
jgi:ankyrin repeat protein